MKSTPPSIQRLIREFNKLPGIGSKTSERFVFHLLRQPKEDIELLVQRLQEIKQAVQLCRECFTFSEQDRCTICADSVRNKKIICVVAEPKDVMAFEKTDQYDGVYHVLGGVINASAGVGPQQLRIEELLRRITDNGVQEIILGTNPDMEGETTALYISQQLKGLPVTVTKIARGLPTGANIEFADESTLGNALTGRQTLK